VSRPTVAHALRVDAHPYPSVVQIVLEPPALVVGVSRAFHRPKELELERKNARADGKVTEALVDAPKVGESIASVVAV
jgi:hypothetical protein